MQRFCYTERLEHATTARDRDVEVVVDQANAYAADQSRCANGQSNHAFVKIPVAKGRYLLRQICMTSWRQTSKQAHANTNTDIHINYHIEVLYTHEYNSCRPDREKEDTHCTVAENGDMSDLCRCICPSLFMIMSTCLSCK
jgi:hypothetical protein